MTLGSIELQPFAMAVDPTIAPPPEHRFISSEGQQSLVVDLPMVQSFTEVELNIGITEIQLCFAGGSTTVIPLPEDIYANAEADSGVAKFSRKRGQLTISWPLPAPIAKATVSKATQATLPPQEKAAEAQVEPRIIIEAGSQEIETDDGVLIEEILDDGVVIEEICIDDTVAAQEQAGKAAPAYGSLWNANSWHWETKNGLEKLRIEVQLSLEQCMAEKLKHVNAMNGASVVLTTICTNGEATFSLRKGKRILYYEISVSFNWEVRDAYGALLGSKGKGKVEELTQEDDTPQVSIEVSTTFHGGADAKAAGEWMKRHGSKEVGKYLMGPRLSEAMLASEAARANVDQDKALRKEERAKAEAAQTATSETRERLLSEQKHLEEVKRIKPTEGAVQGSVWNANAWHWEEKPMTTWAHAWLQRKLAEVTMSIFGGLATATLSDPQVSGDASMSVRKGKPIHMFQLRLECKWEVTATAAGVGDAFGTLVVPEFTSEDGAKGSVIEVRAGGSANRQLINAVKRDGVPAVRAVLAQFIEEMKVHHERSA